MQKNHQQTRPNNESKNNNDDYDIDIYQETPQINMPKTSRNLEPNL